MCESPEYSSREAMLRRCLCVTAKNYHAYGGRGISVCTRWRESFEAFFADMGPRPPGTSLDRIDVNGNYEPANCRWATAVVQSNNRGSYNRVLDTRGERLTIAQWAERSGIPHSVICGRLARGWSEERAVSEPVQTKSRHQPVPEQHSER